MPVIGRADSHHIYILVGQQLAVIHVGFDVRVPAALDAFLPMRTIHIAHRNHFDALRPRHFVDDVAAAGAETNAADADRFVGRLRRKESRRKS